MRSPLRIVTTILGGFFTLQGLAWLVAPTRTAAGLGMPLLDGLARTTNDTITERHGTPSAAAYLIQLRAFRSMTGSMGCPTMS